MGHIVDFPISPKPTTTLYVLGVVAVVVVVVVSVGSVPVVVVVVVVVVVGVVGVGVGVGVVSACVGTANNGLRSAIVVVFVVVFVDDVNLRAANLSAHFSHTQTCSLGVTCCVCVCVCVDVHDNMEQELHKLWPPYIFCTFLPVQNLNNNNNNNNNNNHNNNNNRITTN